MKVTLFSTNSNHFDGELLQTTAFPSCRQNLEETLANFDNLELSVVTQKPGMFLLDLKGNSISEKAKNANYTVLPEEANVEDVAKAIIEQKPDLAIAASFYVAPYDWLSINDGLVSDLLNKTGIKTVCHPVKASLLCFDKNQTQFILDKFEMGIPDTLFVHHQLFFCAGNRKEVNTNVYADSVRAQLRHMEFPVIIKDTVGLSSYGMEVCQSFEEADNFLKSKRNNSDRIIQPLVKGIQAGTEIHGTPGNYTVLDPFVFSVNKYGITSPKQSVKLGPITEDSSMDFQLNELKKKLCALAEDLKLEGIAQVDLVFANDRWYVIEINPRLSGQTTTYAACLDKPVFTLLLESAGIVQSAEKKKESEEKTFAMNFKLPLLEEDQFKKVASLPYIKSIQQIQNFAAKQEREKGYCEIIMTGKGSVSSVMENLEKFKKTHPELIEEVFYENALELSKLL